MTKIDQIETLILDIPTIRGHVLSMATMRTQTAVLVRVKFSDGSEGIGEGTTIGGLSYGPESPEGIQSAIETYIAPGLLGRNSDDVNGAIQLIDKLVKGNRIAKTAVEIALWDGLGKRLGVPVSQLFGGAVHERLPVAWTLASGNSETDIAEAQQMIETRRHNVFKLKIGKRAVRDDVAHVARIKEAVGDAASVRVDINTAWSLQDARWGLRGLQEAGCELVEQPVPARYRRAMAELTRSYEIAVMADEALNGPEDALEVVTAQAADVFAVKIGQSGGLKRASEVIAIGQAAGLGLYGGTMLETGLSTVAALQLFSTVDDLAWGTELFGPLLLTEDILANPIVYRDFCVEIPHGPGIGATLDPDKIDFFRRDGRRSMKAVAGE
ncbi:MULTISPECIES: muconate/chloromuconate family cycloisomerase [Roseobacteraceae]|uniref:muconate/chloromuconate family cycloisomerase n=1 Tax=Roseobacteraceae TaxID=2854170 RepID=UPI000590587B|nr:MULTISPECIES: muconate/chloromuconate family cycloisomerase [Roseobacteraceae]MBO9436174.1 muconate/chloromuconate family cycloisomerase [Ruegeria sp. R13_0]MBO9448514.1 muconate/chloromuconate family cycloisomerase [Ruegeria sp. R14_0]MBO9467652.1 muconate/chloromuconate family cycloisomerase [Tropicibacter sp. R15_0]MCG7630307.1 muconate/chloromuconate family cycloisomerase [Epibacterium sp. MM17-32]KII16241.1 muconate cycloisomerase [Phaeobacter sp. S60]